MLADAQTLPENVTPEEKNRMMWTAASLYTGTSRINMHHLCALLIFSPNQLQFIRSVQHGLYLFLLTNVSFQTAASLQVFILAMTIHRSVQVKIQEEIERVTGGKRLPELSDMDSMPYVRCVILEVLRWQPVTPLGEYLRVRIYYELSL